MGSRMEEFPVTSSSPIPFCNYWINAFAWEQQILNRPAWLAAYLNCSDNAARFRFVETFAAKVLKLELNPKIIFHGKNAVKAEAARQIGNHLITHEDLPGALAAYNQSIRNAPFKDKGCIVLALGNRSLVFFHLGRYAECIRDIDQAVMLGYPLDSVKKLLIRKAKAFLALSQPQAAICVLEKEGHLLNVCSGSREEISKLDGNMSDYSELLAAALHKRKEEDEASVGEVNCVVTPDIRSTFSTGWETHEEIKKVELCDGPGRRFPSLSAAVALRSSSLQQEPIADRDLDVGDVLLVEPAFVSAVDEKSWSTNCYACLCWTDAPFPCCECSVVIFCSPACASGPKAALHARECKFWLSVNLSKEEADGPTTSPGSLLFCRYGMLAVRMLLTKSAEEWLLLVEEQANNILEAPISSAKGRYRDQELMDVLSLASLSEPKEPEAMKERMSPVVGLLALFIVRVLETEYFSGVTFSKRARRRFGGIVMRALDFCGRKYGVSMEMVAPALVKVAYPCTVLHPVYSLFRPSCHANSIGVHFGDVVVVRACRPVQKGEVLTAPQVLFQSFTLVPRLGRQTILRVHGFDECKCRACVEDWPSMEKLHDEYHQASCRVKCPVCSHVLGPLDWVVGRPKRLVGVCSECKADGREFVAIFSQHVFDPESPVRVSDPVTLDETFARVRAVRSIFVEPSFVIVEADLALQSALLLKGNKGFAR